MYYIVFAVLNIRYVMSLAALFFTLGGFNAWHTHTDHSDYVTDEDYATFLVASKVRRAWLTN